MEQVKVKVLGYRVMVKPEEEEKTPGGIVLPETAKEKPQKGIVVAVGDGKRTEDGKLIKPDVEVGDKVIFGKYAGHEVTIDGEEYIILDADQVYGKLVEE